MKKLNKPLLKNCWGAPLSDAALPPKQLARGAPNKLFCSGPAKKEKRFVIPFYHEKISVIQKNNKELLVPLRQFCDIIGIDWSSQLKKLKNDPVFEPVLRKIPLTASDSKVYFSDVLPLEYLNGFLFTISVKRLSDEQARNKLILYKQECYKVLFNYFNKGFALNAKKLKNPSTQKALVAEVKKALVTPLPFEVNKIQYTFLAEDNSQYGKTVLKHSLDSYFEMLRLVDSNIQFKDLKKGVSKLASPSTKKLVAVKGIKGRQNVYNIEIFKTHLLSLPLTTRESLSELGYDTVYNSLKKFIADNKHYCFDAEEGAISMHTDAFFEALILSNKNYLLLRNIVYVILCKNSNFYVGSHISYMKDRFPDHQLVKHKNFKCFLFLIQCSNDFGAREVEQAIFDKLSKATLRGHEDFEKAGSLGFAVNLDILTSCVTDVFTIRAPHLLFIKGNDVLQASQWVKSLQENSALPKN